MSHDAGQRAVLQRWHDDMTYTLIGARLGDPAAGERYEVLTSAANDLIADDASFEPEDFHAMLTAARERVAAMTPDDATRFLVDYDAGGNSSN